MTTTTLDTAATLRAIAGMIEDGCPAPIGISILASGPRVQVRHEHLADWLIALDLPMPTWRLTSSWDGALAHWKPGTFDGLPFRLDCVDLHEDTALSTLRTPREW
jgi:hypothetical protein